MITERRFYYGIKIKLILYTTLYFNLCAVSQINTGINIFKSEEFLINPKNFVTSKQAHDLIKEGKRFQIYYGLFRVGYSSCVTSSAKIFHFEPIFINHACIVDRQLSDSIEVFNSIMARRITTIEGHGWQKVLKEESENCIVNICGTNDNVDDFIVFGLNNSLIGYKYNFNQYELDSIRLCLIDQSLGGFLTEYPKAKILLRGYSNANEGSKLLAQKRIDRITEYLITKGIEGSRLSTEVVIVEENNINNDFSVNRVDFSIISFD